MLNLKTDRVAFSGRRGCQGGAGARGRGARGRFGAIGRSSTRTSFSLGLVSFRSASKVRAESVRSGPCAWRIGRDEVSDDVVTRAPSEKAK